MNRQLFLLVSAFAWITWPANLGAQEDAVVREGDRVRVSAAEYGERLLVGEVMTHSLDTLTMNRWRPTISRWEVLDIPVDSITSLEVSRGARSNAGKGALIGGLIGGAFGLAAGIAAASYDCDSDAWDWDGCWYWGEGEIVPLSTMTFGLLGAGVGALIGTTSRSEIWQPIPSGRLRVGISRTSGDVAVAFSLSH